MLPALAKSSERYEMLRGTQLRLRGERLKNALLLRASGINYQKELGEWIGDIGVFLQQNGKQPVSRNSKGELFNMRELSFAPDGSNAPECATLIDFIMKQVGI